MINREGTQWKPGQSGNPNGRPLKLQSITSWVKDYLDREGEQGKTNAELIAMAIISLCKDPNRRGFTPALEQLLNRVEGKIASEVNIRSLNISISGQELAEYLQLAKQADILLLEEG